MIKGLHHVSMKCATEAVLSQALEFYRPPFDHGELYRQMQERSVRECALAPEVYAQED